MFWEVLAAIVLGVHAGVFTGLIPGIHINLVSVLLLSASPYLLKYTTPIVLAVFIISMSITHTFLDAIPSIFLGAPDASMVVSVLPGHKMLLEGKGAEAVKLTVIGSLLCLILGVILVPLMIPFVGAVYPYLKVRMGTILIVIVGYMILKDEKKWLNLLVFAMSGILGIFVLNMPLRNPLFPMLSGLFGLSMLVVSLTQKVILPKQKVGDTINISRTTVAKAVGAGTIAGTLTSFFPGLGPAQGAVLASQITKDIGDYGFMILVGGINTVNFALSLVTLFVLDKARNGAVIAVMALMDGIDTTTLILFLFVALTVGGIAAVLALTLSKSFSKLITRVNYRKLVWSVIILICILTFVLSGPLGFLILGISTAIGIIPGELGVGRNHAMGCLLLPVILFFTL